MVRRRNQQPVTCASINQLQMQAQAVGAADLPRMRLPHSRSPPHDTPHAHRVIPTLYGHCGYSPLYELGCGGVCKRRDGHCAGDGNCNASAPCQLTADYGCCVDCGPPYVTSAVDNRVACASVPSTGVPTVASAASKLSVASAHSIVPAHRPATPALSRTVTSRRQPLTSPLRSCTIPS